MIGNLHDIDIGRPVKEFIECSCPHCRQGIDGRLLSYDNDQRIAYYVRDPLSTLDTWRNYRAYAVSYDLVTFTDDTTEFRWLSIATIEGGEHEKYQLYVR